ncbi:MAG: type II toxin-antitoxin system RelE/ParE family toxin [Coriobacteriia bacterium]|nr:type II toxin-antitoxin system RelE/ParE family toxin [Coriobacteriia bacterium]
MRVIWSDRALGRVEEIALFIAQDNGEAAVNWTLELFDAVERLGEFPLSGKASREPRAVGVRELVFGAYRVFYQIRADVEVLSVRRGSELVGEEDLSGD